MPVYTIAITVNRDNEDPTARRTGQDQVNLQEQKHADMKAAVVSASSDKIFEGSWDRASISIQKTS